MPVVQLDPTAETASNAPSNDATGTLAAVLRAVLCCLSIEPQPLEGRRERVLASRLGGDGREAAGSCRPCDGRNAAAAVDHLRGCAAVGCCLGCVSAVAACARHGLGATESDASVDVRRGLCVLGCERILALSACQCVLVIHEQGCWHCSAAIRAPATHVERSQELHRPCRRRHRTRGRCCRGLPWCCCRDLNNEKAVRGRAELRRRRREGGRGRFAVCGCGCGHGRSRG